MRAGANARLKPPDGCSGHDPLKCSLQAIA